MSLNIHIDTSIIYTLMRVGATMLVIAILCVLLLWIAAKSYRQGYQDALDALKERR